MTSDDEKSKPNTHISEAKFTISPISFADFDAAPTQNGLEEKQDIGSDIEIEQYGPDDVHQTVVDSDREPQLGYMFSERENVSNDVSKHDRSRTPERTSKSKSKRGSDSRPTHEKSGHSKRSKHGNLSQPHSSHPRDHILSESPQTVPIDRVVLEPYKGRTSQMTNRALKDGTADSECGKDNLELSGKSPDRYCTLNMCRYKEYVQEYLEKFDSYCTLNKTLETYRNEFLKLGKDLESAKGKDQEKYFQILRQLNDSYHQCGNRHKRLKKIFVVLHEELKYLKQAIKDYAAAFGRE